MSLKSTLEHVLSGRVAIRIGRARRAGTSLILAYHNVIPDHAPPGGDQSLHLPVSSFRAQLDALQSLGRIAPLEEVLATRDSGLRFAVTFDDAYAGAVANGIPELARRGLAATVFVAPGLLGLEQPWWDLLAGAAGLTPEVRTRCLEQYSGAGETIRRHHGLPPAMSADDGPYRIASEAELGASLVDHGMTMAAHSWSHPNLGRLTEGELRSELSTSLRWLSRWPAEVSRPWLAYPYGLSTPVVRRLTAESGYSAGLTIGGGWYAEGQDRMSIPRYNVPSGVSLQGFVARICGLIDP